MIHPSTQFWELLSQRADKPRLTIRFCRMHFQTMTMTMTMTLREVQHPSMKAWPYRRECRGHDPAKKICYTDEVCTFGKVCTIPLLRTVCSTSSHEMNSKRRKTRNGTQAVAGMNSQIQISGILGFGATQRRSRGNQEVTSRPGKPRKKNKHPKRKLAGTAAHQSLLFPNQILLLWYEEFTRNIFILCRELVTLFLTIKRQPIAMFFSAGLLLLSNASSC